MPGTSREEFLKSVRTALKRPEGAPATPYPRLAEDVATLRRRVAEVEARLERARPALVERFVEMAPKSGWTLVRAADHAQGLARLGELAHERGWRNALRSDHPVFQRLPLAALVPSLDVRLMALSTGRAREALRHEVTENTDVGITGVTYAMAETATVVLLPQKGVSRLVSLLPPVHVAVVETSQVIESMDDLFLFRRLAYYEGGMDMGSSMNFITGPSRTGDIEQTVVTGVHGPREVSLLLIG